MEKNIFKKLVCPYCKTEIEIRKNNLFCSHCKGVFNIKDGILTLTRDKEWANYHETIYKKARPQPPHPFYNQFLLDKGYERVLDVGCGDGVMSCEIVKERQLKELWGISPDISGLYLFKNRNLNKVHLIKGYGEFLPFPNGYFDVVTSVFVIEHIKNPLPYLKEIKRVLKPTGKFIISMDNRFYYILLRPIIGLFTKFEWLKNDPTHINMMYPHQLKNYLRNTGFLIRNEIIHYPTEKYLPRLHKLMTILIPCAIRERFLNTTFTYIVTKGQNI